MKTKTVSIAAMAALVLLSGCSAPSSKDAASSRSDSSQPLTFDQTSGSDLSEGVIFQDEISLSQEGGIPLDGSAPETQSSIDMKEGSN